MLKTLLTYLLSVVFLINAYPTDIKFLRLRLKIDPSVKYIKASATEVFSITQTTMPIEIELSDSLKINYILHKKQKANFSHQNGIISIMPNGFWSETDSITIDYEGIPCSTGLGSTKFTIHNGEPIFWTLSEPYGAKDWFPCRQDINDKIDSSFITIECPEKYNAISNGKLTKEYTKNGTRILEFQHKYPCAYYLLGIAITKYKTYYDYVIFDKDTFKIANYVYPDYYEQAKRKTWKLAPVFKMFCEYFGEYPFKKESYSHAQFSWSGGMEHQTVSFITDFDLDLMIHELAHQWFGNFITCKSWKDIFLNEGFATYCEHLAVEKGLASTSNEVQWRRATINKACQLNNSCLEIMDTLDIHTLFNTRICYYKGAMVLHQLRRELGDEIFFKALKEYLNKETIHYKNASIKDFIDIVSEVSQRNLDWFFSQWFYGKGYPIYEIKWQQRTSEIIDLNFSQQPSDGSTRFFRAKVPLMIYGENGEKILYRFNNYYQSQYFTLKTNFVVSRIVFDPNCDILSQGSQVKKAELTVKKVRTNKRQKDLNKKSNQSKKSSYQSAACLSEPFISEGFTPNPCPPCS